MISSLFPATTTSKVLALDNGRWFLHTEHLLSIVQPRLGRIAKGCMVAWFVFYRAIAVG